MKYERSYSLDKTLTKDTRHQKLAGVCAGIATYYHLPRLGIRIATIIALMTLPIAIGVAYLLGAVLMPSSDD